MLYNSNWEPVTSRGIILSFECPNAATHIESPVLTLFKIKQLAFEEKQHKQITVSYGTFISDLAVLIYMSQILDPRQNRNEILLFQDLYYIKKGTPLKTAVKEAICSICEKGLEDGMTVTAKTIKQKTRFFCQYHLPVDF